MTICTWWLFGREVFNWDLFFSYKFLWRSAPGDSLEEEFSSRVYSFPTNSYDDLHLATLWKRSFQLGSIIFLQIPMTICICLVFERGSFQLGSTPFLQIPMTICTWLLFGKGSFQLGSTPFLQIPMTICTWRLFGKRSFQLGSILFLQIPMTICTWRLFRRGVFN